MKKLVLLATLSLLVITTSHAQFFQWANSQANNLVGTTLAAGNNFLVASGQFHQSITLGNQTFTSSDSLNAYLAAYDFSGNILWARQIVNRSAILNQVTVDANQHIIVSGVFTDSLLIGNLLFKSTTPNAQGVFVAKFNAGGTLLWAQSSAINPGLQVLQTSVSTDAAGNIILGGTFSGNITFGTTSYSAPGYNRAFAVKYDPAGLQQWVVQSTFGGVQTEARVKATSTGDIYLTTMSSTLGTPINGIYVEKLNSSGTFIWEALALTEPAGINYNLTTDPAGNLYMAGTNLQGISFTNFSVNSISVPNQSIKSVFIAKLSSGGAWSWARPLATGNYAAETPSVFFSPKNELIVSGSFAGTANFMPNLPLQSMPANTHNSYITNLDSAGAYNWSNMVSGTNYNVNTGLAGDANGNFYVSGYYINGTANFNAHVLTTNQFSETYLAKVAENSNTVSGSVFLDANSNGMKDPTEMPFEYVLLETSPGPFYQVSNSGGNYKFFLPAGGYNISIPNGPRHHTIVPGNHNVTFSGISQTQTGKDFALQPIPNQQDVQVTVTNLTPARPGFDIRYRITYRNMGTTTVSDTISLKFDATYLTLIGATVSPATQTTGRLQ
ncbi:MAG TPA: hypothetical protein VK927_08475, partial [Adhaeribacter sp.]|nr:hypothetical protein [Adhaeribacter sp.]